MKTLFLTLAAMCLAGATGCVSTEKTTYRDEPRINVSFENDTAARLFYETLSKAPPKTNKTESNTEVSIPVVFKHKERVVQGDSIIFNEAVRRCDTNNDATITELEARIFAERQEEKK